MIEGQRMSGNKEEEEEEWDLREERKAERSVVLERKRTRWTGLRGLVTCNLRPLKTRWETARLLCLNGMGDGVQAEQEC